MAVMSIVVNDIGSKLICRICVSDCALLLGSVKANISRTKRNFLPTNSKIMNNKQRKLAILSLRVAPSLAFFIFNCFLTTRQEI